MNGGTSCGIGILKFLSTPFRCRSAASGRLRELRTEAFEAAALAYVADDALPSIFPGHDWSVYCRGYFPAIDIEGSAYNSPLTLQWSALTALLRYGRIIPDGQFGSPEERLLAHEQSYWNDSADAVGLPFNALYQRRWLSYLVAAANLFGATTEVEAMGLIARLQAAGNDLAVARGIADWLHGLYPPDDDHEYWGSLQPDRLAEYHLQILAGRQGDLLRMLFGNATIEEAYRAVPLLTRAV